MKTIKDNTRRIRSVKDNHATTNLDIYSNVTFQDKLSRNKIGSLVLSFSYTTNCMKTCSFLHVYFSEAMNVVKNLFLKKLIARNSFIGKAYFVGTHRNCLYEAIPICIDNIFFGK